MAKLSDVDLWDRGIATLIASWEANARGSEGATVLRLEGVAAAVFPVEPERGIYNNAIVERGLGPSAASANVGAMEAVYEAAGVERFAAWVHEGDEPMRAELSGRGYRVAESSRAMALCLRDFCPPARAVAVEEATWAEYLDYLRGFDLPPGLLAGVDPGAYRVLAARIEGETVATALAFDHREDCGVFNVTTYEWARRRGLGTALTVRLLEEARARGQATASLQSTPAAEDVYARIGFRSLGRILEFVPPDR
jgi:GNAT superfamily N-acetyltransferase